MENQNFDDQGKFAEGNNLSKGRPKGSKNRFTQIKEDIIEVWHEEEGKERFRGLFKGSNKDYLKALDVIVSLLPKQDLKDLGMSETKLIIYRPGESEESESQEIGVF